MDDDVITNSKSRRLHGVLEQLRRSDVTGAYDNGPEMTSSVRAELDTFAHALSGLAALPVQRSTTTGSSSSHVTRMMADDGPRERLAMTRGELGRLEALVNRTFDGGRLDQQLQQQRSRTSPNDGSDPTDTEQVCTGSSCCMYVYLSTKRRASHHHSGLYTALALHPVPCCSPCLIHRSSTLSLSQCLL